MFSSGMAAISTTLWTFLRPGDVIVHSEPLYGGTEFLAHNILPQFDIRPEGFGSGGTGRPLEAAIRAGRKRGRVAVIYVETPANPTNGLVDIAHCRERADRLKLEQNHRPPVIVDNTFLGPLWQQPLALGADLVLYSLTKYVGGHSDVIAGAGLGPEALIAPVRGMRTILGTMSDPHTGWLLMRSLETLKLRMTSAMKNARYVAEFLADHPKVDRCTIWASSRRTIRCGGLPTPVQGARLDLLVRGPRRRGRGLPPARPSAADPPGGEPGRHRAWPSTRAP